MAVVLAGISFPFRIEGEGLPKEAKGVDVIKSALIVLLRTPKGSRAMRPTLGTNLYSLLFEDVGPLLESLIQRDIFLAVGDWLPEVNILNIDVLSDETKKVQVNVQYAIQGVIDETGFIVINDQAA